MALFLLPGLAMAQPPAEEQAPAPEPTAPTRATFVSTTSEQWDVVVDDQPICSTPCTGPLFPLQYVVLHSQEFDPVLLEVGRLPPGDLIVSGKPLQHGMYAGGIVATTFGGMGMVVGITLAAIGLAQDRDGMATAGVISGAAGALSLAGGIYLMVRAIPSVTVEQASPTVAGASLGLGGRF